MIYGGKDESILSYFLHLTGIVYSLENLGEKDTAGREAVSRGGTIREAQNALDCTRRAVYYRGGSSNVIMAT